MLHCFKRIISTSSRVRSLSVVIISLLLLILVSSVTFIDNSDADIIYSSKVLNKLTLIRHGDKNPNNIHNDQSDHEAFSQLFTLLANSKPRSEPITRYEKENQKIQRFPEDNVKFDEQFLSKLIDLKTSDKLKLFESYETYLTGLQNLSFDVFGSESSRPIQGNGIVIVGGGKFSWLALLSIHQLRRTGSKLPIEVYIPTSKDYDAAFCNEMLPSVNGRCILGYEVLPLNDFNGFKLKRFEYKILAIFASSFENVLMLDADNIVIQNPDMLFEWNVFLEHQLVLWPDCWIRTTNPFLLDLLHIDVDYSQTNDGKPYDMHDLPGSIPNPSTESGMLLVNKRKHVNTLLLVLYMNFYGFDYYYPLLTQGGAGEGDKDSYIVAAHAINETVYQVRQSLVFLGRHPETGFVAGGLGQCNPMTRKEQYCFENNIPDSPCEDFMFIHLSNPKYYPDEITANLRDEKGADFRQFQDSRLPYDFEVQLWEIMSQLLCSKYVENNIPQTHHESLLIDPQYKLSAKSLKYIKSMNIEKICKKEILPHLQFLREHIIDNSVKLLHNEK